MTGRAALVLAAILVAACAAKAAPTVPAAAPQPQTLTFSGVTSMNTAPFELSGNTYLSIWTKAPGCSFGAYLESPTDNLFGRALGMSYSDGPTSGETWVYHVGPGMYYLKVQGNCPWTIKLASG